MWTLDCGTGDADLELLSLADLELLTLYYGTWTLNLDCRPGPTDLELRSFADLGLRAMDHEP